MRPFIEVKLYAIINDRNETVGLIPLELARRGPFKVSGSPLPGLFTPYQGPILCEASRNKLNEVIRAAVEISKAHYFAASLPPTNSEIPGSDGFVNWEPRRTFVIDLSLGREQLWKNLKVETRNQVRQAQRRGVEIYEPETLNDWLEDYYMMHKAVYARQKMKPPAKLSFYQALWENFYKRGQLKVILARISGKTIAGGIFVIYEDIIYFLDGASLREYQQFRANNLIQWYIISWATTIGLHYYDMVGANIPSIAHFKRGFGGTEIEYPYCRTIRGFIGKIGYRLYYRYRHLVKKLGI